MLINQDNQLIDQPIPQKQDDYQYEHNLNTFDSSHYEEYLVNPFFSEKPIRMDQNPTNENVLNFTSNVHPELSRPYTETTGSPSNIVVEDFNGDLILDVVVGAGDTIHVIDGSSGKSIFTTVFQADDLIINLVTGDFNNDTNPDIALGSWDNKVYVINGLTGEILYINDDPLELSEFSRITPIVAVDFTRDGIEDIIAGSNHRLFGIDGFSGETLFINEDASDMLEQLATADFNDDSIPDVVGATRGGEVHFYSGQDGTIMYSNVNFLGFPSSISVIDFNNNSLPDIAIGFEDSNLYYIDGQTANVEKTNSDILGEPVVTSTADFNLDGLSDVVVGTRDSSIFVCDGNTAGTIYYNQIGVDTIYTLDIAQFNNDNIPDIAVGSLDSNVYFVDGSSGRQFSSVSDAQDAVRSLAIADFNNDTIPDIIAGSSDSNLYFIYGDNYSPELTHAVLPEILATGIPLEFNIFYNEPNQLTKMNFNSG
ncbi:MAG: WD40 repeat domain-containing protein [Candidatus Kariarchaeaceae archaeon]